MNNMYYVSIGNMIASKWPYRSYKHNSIAFLVGLG
jgi:hypothetical protein